MKFEHFIFGFFFISGMSLQIAEPRHSKLADYVNKKLQSIAHWLDSRKDSTIFDYIYQVNYGLGLNLYQGDIKGYNPRHRTAVRDQTYLWNTRVIPYVFDPLFNSEARQDVMQAISEYHAKTCLRFVPRSNQQDYLTFKHISGCYSNIGRQGGEQEVSLMKPCLKMGTAIHEIMHALGFWHEQSRPDRDSWIQVIFANIEKGKQFNFDKLSVDEVDTLGVQYDYGSIMHYSKYSFSKNGNPTILPTRNTNAQIGQRNGLSPLDVKRINTLYRCDIPNPNQPTTSKPTTTPLPTKPTTRLTPPLPTKPTTRLTPPLPTTIKTQQPISTSQPTQKTTSLPTTQYLTPKPPTPKPTMKPTQKPPVQTTLKTTSSPTQKPTLSPTLKPTQLPIQTLPPATLSPLGWSSWSSFTPCDLQCREQRYRFCLNMNSKYCPGSSVETNRCGAPCQPASYLGCWKISLSNLTIPSVEGTYPTLTDNYQGRTGAVRKCADVASIRGYVVFALYDYGMCLTGPNAVRTFSQYGASSDCGYRGKGGTTGVSVYSFQKDIDGQWGLWTEWGQCTRTCGGGEQYRYRHCNNPPPIGNGAECNGLARERRPCNEDKCHADAKCGLRYYMGEPGTSGIIHIENYDNFMSCNYKIETGNGNSTISLAITRIDIEYSRGCLYDILSIYDGPDQFSTPLGDYCGNKRPVPFESSGNALFISFASDATTTAGGYTIEYTVNSKTRKACTQLQQPAHSVMIGTSNFVGDSVVFVCDPGYRMQGTSQLTCVDQRGFALWSDMAPFCIRNFKRSINRPVFNNCTFEGNLCGYLNEKSDDLDWYMVRDRNTQNQIEYYLQTSTAKDQLPGDSAKIQSKIYSGRGDMCLQFSYRLTGNDDTKLKVHILDIFGRDTIVWTGTSDEMELWTTHKTMFFINSSFKVVFEYIVGETVYSSAELDNIVVQDGPCYSQI